MLEHRPTRRDPRVLAIAPTARGVKYAAIDAWEVRGLGEIGHADRGTLRLALTRLLIQTRPSVVVLARRAGSLTAFNAIGQVLRGLAATTGIPVMALSAGQASALRARAPGPSELAGQYPELAALAIRHGHTALRLASGALVSLTFPRRRYATDAPSPGPAVAPRASGLARKPRVPRGAPARRARQRPGARGRHTS